MSTVADFYRDRSVLITGATGFMGKVLVEKLLRSCPGLSKIYLLMRPKGGHHVDARLDELLNSKVRLVVYRPFAAVESGRIKRGAKAVEVGGHACGCVGRVPGLLWLMVQLCVYL